MAAFLERRGCRVFEAAGVVWGHYRGPFYSSLPYHLEIDREPREIHSLMWKHRVGAIRFPTATRAGFPCGHYVCNPAEYDLKKLPRQYRQQIQKGMNYCEVRPVDPDELLVHGLRLNVETMQRQNRFDPEFGDPARWKRFVSAVRDTPEVYAHGAFVDGQLAAYIVGCREGDWLHLLYKMSSNEERAHSVSHVLDYWLMTQTAADPSIRMVANSFVPVLPNDGLDRYKRRIGFTVAPHNMAVYFHPAVSALVTNRVAVSTARRVWQARPQSSRLELAAKLMEGARTTMTNEMAAPATLDPCQHTGCFQYSRLWRPYAMFLLRSAFRRVREEGVMSALRKTVEMISSRPQAPANGRPVAAPTPVTAMPLDLKPGDRVRVKTAEQIQATLDAQGKHRGLAFVPVEMLVHCGKEYPVYKRVEKIFLEESKQNRKLKSTVLLDGVQCQGIGLDCDRSCYLFWREAWLEKVQD